jgi:hypothetical protein
MTTEPTKPKLRIGLLLDSAVISKYILKLMKLAQSHEQLEISHVFLPPPNERATRPRLQNSVGPSETARNPSPTSSHLFRLVVALEKLLLLKNKRHFDHLQQFDISALPPDVIVHQLHDNDVSSLQSAGLDLLILLPTCNLLPDISSIAKLGVISLSHSDDYIDGNGPAGFWEVFFRRDVTDFTIERLSETSGSREILLRGRVGTQFYFLLNQAYLFERSTYYLFKLAEKIAATGELPRSEPNWPFCYAPRTFPSTYQAILYLAGLIRLSASKFLEKARGSLYQWNVAFLHSDWRNAVLRQATIIQNPPGRYMADPFVISQGGRDCCFVEDYDNAAKRGRISVFALGAHNANFVGVALEENFHLSYPFTFHYKGELYMCPETSECREIRIYKCLDFPLRWKLEKTIVKNISAVDTILFERDGKWWMLTNTDPAQWGDHSLELRIFSAPSPLADEWLPHPGNPFFIDALRTRNGGMLTEGDRIFRVAQAMGFDFYGKRTSLFEIMELNEQSYVEKHVFDISPAFKAGIVATHHLHSNGDITVIDFAHDGRALTR